MLYPENQPFSKFRANTMNTYINYASSLKNLFPCRNQSVRQHISCNDIDLAVTGKVFFCDFSFLKLSWSEALEPVLQVQAVPPPAPTHIADLTTSLYVLFA